MVIVCLLWVRHSLTVWRWRNEEFSFYCYTRVLLPVFLQDQRTHSICIPSSYSVLHTAMSSSDTSLLFYSCMPSVFYFCRITWACELASSGATHSFSPHCFSLLITYATSAFLETPYFCSVSCPFPFRVIGAIIHYSVGSDSPPLTLAFFILTKCSHFLPFWIPFVLTGLSRKLSTW